MSFPPPRFLYLSHTKFKKTKKKKPHKSISPIILTTENQTCMRVKRKQKTLDLFFLSPPLDIITWAHRTQKLQQNSARFFLFLFFKRNIYL